MIVNKDIKKLPKSSVQLALTLSKDSAKQEYDSLLKRYVQQVALPGFRKGKVPVSVLEKKFGEGLKTEAMQSLVDKALHEVFETIEEKPLTFSQPRILENDLKLDLDKDFTFTLEYDVYPEIKVGNYKGVEVEQPVVALAPEDEKRELEKIQDQNSMLVEKASGVSDKNDTVTVNFVELDAEGKEIESTRRQDFVFTLGTGYNFYKFDDEIQGMKKDEEKVIEKTYLADFESSELAGQKKSIKVKLTMVKEKKIPALDDDLAQDVNEEYKTLDDLKKAINERLQKNLEARLKNKTVEALLDKLAGECAFEVPVSMLNAEMEQTWRSFAAQSRMEPEQMEQIIGQEGKTKLFADWAPQSEKALRRRLVMEKILELEKIEASEDELNEEIKKQAEASKMSFEETKDYFEKNSLKHYLEHDIRDRKLEDFLLASAKIKKGKKQSYLDLLEGKE